MLSEIPQKLKSRLDELIAREGETAPPPIKEEDPYAGLLPEYKSLAREMVVGIEIWLLKIFSAKAKVRIYAFNLDEECKQLQLSLIRSLDDCLAPEVDNLLRFEYELRNTLHYFVRFNTVIKQNISLILHKLPKLMHDRDMRAANFYITKSRTDFLKLLEKGDDLSAKLGGTQAEEMTGIMLDAEKGKGQFLEILFAEKGEGEDLQMLFSEEEQEILSRWFEDREEGADQ